MVHVQRGLRTPGRDGIDSSRASNQPGLITSPPRRAAVIKKPRHRAVGAMWAAVLLFLVLFMFKRQDPPHHRGAAVVVGVQTGTRQSLANAAELMRHVQGMAVHQYRRQDVTTAFREALITVGYLPRHATSTSEAQSEKGSEGSADSSPPPPELVTAVSGLLSGLRAAGEPLRCPWDATLPTNSSSFGRLLVAGTLHNNEVLMPHLLLQLLALALYLPPQSIYVSLYESGSGDATGAWLALFQEIVKLLPLSTKVTTAGSLQPGKGQDKSTFLASVRNAALAPLWSVRDPWQADRVVFLNDVWLCAADVVRLLSHEDAHIVCGLDFRRPTLDELSRNEQGELFAKAVKRKTGMALPLGRALGRWTTALHIWSRSAATRAAFRAATSPLLHDTWIVRDISGRAAIRKPPFLRHAASAQLLMAGHTVPVASCWNGLVVLKASPFLAGLRMRSAFKGECAASERSILCSDYARLGHQRFLIDPGVRLAYSRDDATVVQNEVNGLTNRSWAETAAHHVDWKSVSFPPQVDCCGRPQGKDSIDFTDGCLAEPSLGGRNWTQDAIADARAFLNG